MRGLVDLSLTIIKHLLSEHYNQNHLFFLSSSIGHKSEEKKFNLEICIKTNGLHMRKTIDWFTRMNDSSISKLFNF